MLVKTKLDRGMVAFFCLLVKLIIWIYIIRCAYIYWQAYKPSMKACVCFKQASGDYGLRPTADVHGSCQTGKLFASRGESDALAAGGERADPPARRRVRPQAVRSHRQSRAPDSGRRGRARLRPATAGAARQLQPRCLRLERQAPGDALHRSQRRNLSVRSAPRAGEIPPQVSRCKNQRLSEFHPQSQREGGR